MSSLAAPKLLRISAVFLIICTFSRAEGTGGASSPNLDEQISQATDAGNNLGLTLGDTKANLSDPAVTQTITNAQLTQQKLERDLQKKVKNKEITKKQADEQRLANALAAQAAFNQAAGAAAAGGESKGSKSTKRPSQRNTGSVETEAPGSGGPTNSYSPSYTTPTPFALDRGPERVSREGSPSGGEIADTSLQGRSSASPAVQSALGLVSVGGAGSITENESRTDGAEPLDPERGEERTSAANGGAVAGLGAVAPGTEPTPSEPAGLDKLDELLLKTAIQVKQRLNKQAKDGKGAGPTATDRGLASVQDSSAARSDAPYAGTAAAKPSAIGMADLFGADAPLESGSSLSAKRLARDLAAKLDETSEELVGSKLAVWFLLFFIGGFGAFLFIRRRAK